MMTSLELELTELRRISLQQIFETNDLLLRTAADRLHLQEWGNHSRSIMVSFGSTLFSLFLDQVSRCAVIYAKNGHLAVGEVSISLDGPLLGEDELNALKKTLRKFDERSIVACSRCKCEVDSKDALAKGHVVYAGAYCDRCAGTERFSIEKQEEGI